MQRIPLEMASTWKTIQINSKAYIFKIRHNGAHNKTTCFLSDFKTIWSEVLDSSELLSRAKKANEFLDVDDAILKSTLSYLQTESNATPSKVELADINAELGLSLTYNVKNVPFVFSWYLSQCTINVFFEEVTKAFLGHVAHLENETATLRALIVRKDAEIAQYKEEHTLPLKRPHLITEPFHQSQIQSKHLFDWSLLPLEECWKADAVEEMEAVQIAGSAAEPNHSTEIPSAMAKEKKIFKSKLTKQEQAAAPKLVYDEYDSQENCIDDIFSSTNDNKGLESQQTQSENGTTSTQPPLKIRKTFNL